MTVRGTAFLSRCLWSVFAALLWSPAQGAAPDRFTLEQVRDYSYPEGLTAAKRGKRVAWIANQRGQRNVWVAEGPQFAARQLTGYARDDGQELTSLQLSADGQYVVYVRGGQHASRGVAEPINPGAQPRGHQLQLLAVPFAGGEPQVIADGGDLPVLSPTRSELVFLRGGQVWRVALGGSEPATPIISGLGSVGDLRWSPDGARLAFTAKRGDHAFIGVYSNAETPIVWLAPSTSRDSSASWSPDGTKIAFVRRLGVGGARRVLLEDVADPWSIWIADAASGQGRLRWQSASGMRGTLPGFYGADGTQLTWTAAQRLVFFSYLQGWPHLYSLPVQAGEAQQLTVGNYSVESFSLAPNGKEVMFVANTGPEPDDIDRRHLFVTPVDQAKPRQLTKGQGLEWSPVMTGDAEHMLLISSTAQRPALPAVLSSRGELRLLATETLPKSYPAQLLVTPKRVSFTAADGMRVNAQLFEPAKSSGQGPAVVYVHGGPHRQMLLGWPDSDYYGNVYAINQYLVSQGYRVLSVNYRFSTGYGYDYMKPSLNGALVDPYQDVKAAGEYLRGLPQVAANRIGVYGGSYGGYLTALALGKDSQLFAAGVDLHGVHDRSGSPSGRPDSPVDEARVLEMSWQASPIAWVSQWRSPVLLIHGDEDKSVAFGETVDLLQRLTQASVPVEELVFPFDTHHTHLYANTLRTNDAIVEFLQRRLNGRNTDPDGCKARRECSR